MGLHAIQLEIYQQPAINFDIIRGITPVKTEPEILRSINELISIQVVTQQLLVQLASGKVQAGQAFIQPAQRAADASGFDGDAAQIRMLTQKVEELEKRLDEKQHQARGMSAAGK